MMPLLIEHAAVPGVFQRLLGTELGVDGFQLPGALQAALVAALAHDIAVAAQGLALGVGPVGQQVDPVLALVIVAGELGGWDELHAILHRVVVGILHAAQGVVVRDGHGVQPHPGCHQGQPGHGHGAIGIGGVVV